MTEKRDRRGGWGRGGTVAGRILCALSLVLIAAAPLRAEVRVGEVVVTASRLEEPLGETTSPVIVITREEIEGLNVEFVTDVLRQVTDLNLTQSGGMGRLATVSLRGGSSGQTLVMLDGVKVKSTTTGQFDFSGLTAEDIERIEIVKGPQSTIYGAEAVSGVINIITRRGSGRPSAELSYGSGAYGTSSSALTVSGGSESYNYRLTNSYFRTDGISALAFGTEPDGYENISSSWKFGVRASKDLTLEVTGKYCEDKGDLDGFGEDYPNYVQEGRHSVLSTRAVYHASGTWEQVLTISRVEDYLKHTNSDNPLDDSEITTGIETVDWQHNFYMAEGYTIIMGAEQRFERGESNSSAGEFSEDSSGTGLYLNIKRKMDRLTLSLGARRDEHETFGGESTYRIAVVEDMGEGVRFRASYATGFKAPTFNDLYWPGAGNSLLKPERSRSWEVGVEQDYTENTLIAVTYFVQNYEDLIQWLPDPITGSYQPVNVDEARVRGLESSLRYRLTGALDLKMGYTYLDAEDRQTGERLQMRPKGKFNLGLDYSSGALSLHGDYVYVGERVDYYGALGSYHLVNLAGSYRPAGYAEIFVRAENVFDEDYEEVRDYGTPGASFYWGLKLSF